MLLSFYFVIVLCSLYVFVQHTEHPLSTTGDAQQENRRDGVDLRKATLYSCDTNTLHGDTLYNAWLKDSMHAIMEMLISTWCVGGYECMTSMGIYKCQWVFRPVIKVRVFIRR